jgi:hypothetical protein
LKFVEKGLQRALSTEFGESYDDPITVIYHIDGVDVEVPLLMDLDTPELESFQKAFDDTWIDALTWARLQ